MSDAVYPVLMPKAGNDMEEGLLVKWYKAEGDSVEKGDILFEIETEKSTIEVEAEHTGVLKRIAVPEGETVAVLVPVAYIVDGDIDLDAWLAAQPAPRERQSPDWQQNEGVIEAATSSCKRSDERPSPDWQAGDRVKASPAARRAAQERGVDLRAVPGSGPEGRVLSSDVATATPAVAPAPALVVPDGATLIKMSPMRKTIARNLTQSVTTAPHFFMKLTVDAVEFEGFCKQQKGACGASVNAVLLAAVAKTMMAFPQFRSQVHGTDILQFDSANIGLAVALEDGLRVPVITGIDKQSLAELAETTRATIQQARDGKAVNAGLGTFTISNLGMTSIEEFTAIINPPEAAILAVGRIKDDVKIVSGKVKATKTMTVWLSSDHRIIDGMVAAQFLTALQGELETPVAL